MFPLLLLPILVVAGAAGVVTLSRKLYLYIKKRVTLCRIRKNFSEKALEVDPKDEKCAICLEDFQLGDVTLFLKCDHFFHKKCFLKFLRLEISVQTCPLCRGSF